MVKYKISLKLKDSQDLKDIHDYILELTPQQENNPEQIFTQEIRQSMQTTLQKQSECEINSNQLNKIIEAWLEDIKEGYRASIITLDLRPLIAARINQLQESGNQSLPDLIYPNLSEVSPSWGMLPPLNFC